MFDIPVVLFLYRRLDTTLKIIEAISKVRPKKIYLISDGGKTEQVHQEILDNRLIIESAIDWECQIVKNYSDSNRGVYLNIGEGAKWVFEREKYAIFLEDDNLPEKDFFEFCREMLHRYKDDKRILWICGTNYLENYETNNSESYVFTKHLMPCGWASWSDKFNKMYDGELQTYNSEMSNTLKSQYSDLALYKQQRYSIERTKHKLENNINSSSWDFQMAYSVRINSSYGISPKVNLIKNIGVDELSTHGGSSLNRVMTERFCDIESYKLDFPLVHPTLVVSDPTYEKLVGKIILYPLNYRILFAIVRFVKRIFGFSKYDSIDEKIRNLKQRVKNK